MRPAFIFFDVAYTLLDKPDLWPRMRAVLVQHDYDLEAGRLRLRHRLLAETIQFPDRPDSAFYRRFNRRLLLSLGIPPGEGLLDSLYDACRGLPWRPFADAETLRRLPVPVGILSNWDDTLREKLAAHFPDLAFDPILVSSEVGVAKPSAALFEKAVDRVGCPAGSILYVGDSPRLDLFPALRCGLQAYLIDRDDLFPALAPTGRRLAGLADIEHLLAGPGRPAGESPDIEPTAG